ncbi:hypothetical protein [Nonomuraea dietziae]|uniref:hypothetical protein n=1 Tax=Nonomuraea dietziae TaxID=65515 RepID=UPI0031D50DF8
MRTDVLHAVRLARMDLKLLGRNTTAVFNVLLLPLLFAWMLSQGGSESFILTGMPGVLLAFAVFMNLVNSFTARREELVLKRLRGGQGSAVAIFGGAGPWRRWRSSSCRWRCWWCGSTARAVVCRRTCR